MPGQPTPSGDPALPGAGRLAALGVPPTLPNFDQLIDGQIDNVAMRLAESAGVPPEAVDVALPTIKAGVQQVAEQAKASAKGGSDPTNWIRPHPNYLDWPAQMVVEVTTGDMGSDFVKLIIGNACYDENNSRQQGQVFEGVGLPALAPNTTQTITVNLTRAVASWFDREKSLWPCDGSGATGDKTDGPSNNAWNTAYADYTTTLVVWTAYSRYKPSWGQRLQDTVEQDTLSLRAYRSVTRP